MSQSSRSLGLLQRMRAMPNLRAMSTVKEAFQKTIQKKGPAISRLDDISAKLEMYALFKQAKQGDVQGDRPSMLDFRGRSKFDAWSKLKGMEQSEAMEEYCTKAAELVGEGSSSSTNSSNSSSSPSVPFATVADAFSSYPAPPSDLTATSYSTLNVECDFGESGSGVVKVMLNRPQRVNACTFLMWAELLDFFRKVDGDMRARVVVLGGEGQNFCAGMDLTVFEELHSQFLAAPCEARKREGLGRAIELLQDACSAPERCRVPVIAMVQGACVGGGVDLASACDMRYCDPGAYFEVKEVDLGIVADLGTLQRLPYLVGQQRASEMSYTGRRVGGEEAASIGLVLECVSSDECLHSRVMEVAEQIAAKSPLTIRGIKKSLVSSRDRPVELGLEQVRMLNSATLMSTDLQEAMGAAMSQTAPTYSLD